MEEKNIKENGQRKIRERMGRKKIKDLVLTCI
jgi:hypothetical protein